ncbi:hypothetical protein EYF80_013909 [Liparis tanakae]|uniref:Uncharacterized protein n=1 Tax=Liparis tanakae TaxID=230148 RepID=A0A4Z2ICY5_9TELE|nr:hypothetical protein EYF80_013909 [Liparis tanakae]
MSSSSCSPSCCCSQPNARLPNVFTSTFTCRWRITVSSSGCSAYHSVEEGGVQLHFVLLGDLQQRLQGLAPRLHRVRQQGHGPEVRTHLTGGQLLQEPLRPADEGEPIRRSGRGAEGDHVHPLPLEQVQQVRRRGVAGRVDRQQDGVYLSDRHQVGGVFAVGRLLAACAALLAVGARLRLDEQLLLQEVQVQDGVAFPLERPVGPQQHAGGHGRVADPTVPRRPQEQGVVLRVRDNPGPQHLAPHLKQKEWNVFCVTAWPFCSISCKRTRDSCREPGRLGERAPPPPHGGPASYPQRVNTGLEVVGDGVRLEEGVVRDGAERVVGAAEFLLQRHGLPEAGLFGRRLGAGVEQGGVARPQPPISTVKLLWSGCRPSACSMSLLNNLLHCKKYQYGVFVLLRDFTRSSSPSSSSPSRYRRSWTYGLIFLYVLLEDMSVEKEPKCSRSGGSFSAGAEGDPRGSAPAWEEADRDTVLADSSCQGVGVRTSPEDRCRDTSRAPVRLRVPVEF